MSPGKPWECRVFRGSLLWSGGNSFLFRPSIGAYSRAVTEEPNSGGCRRLALSRQNKKIPQSLAALRDLDGGRYRTRTCDPLHVKQVL